MPGRNRFRRWRSLSDLGRSALALVVGTNPAFAFDSQPASMMEEINSLASGLRHHELFGIAFSFGLLIFSLTTAALHVKAQIGLGALRAGDAGGH